MSVFEKALNEAKPPVPTREASGPTLKEILGNAANSELFGQYLEKEGEDDPRVQELAGRLVTGDLSPDDLVELADYQKGFYELTQRSEAILKTLDTKMIKELLAFSPDLEKIAAVVGPEGIQAALKRYMTKLVITDRSRFEDMENYILDMEKIKELGKQQDVLIMGHFKEYGMTEEQYMEIMNGGGDVQSIARRLNPRGSGWFKGNAKEVAALAAHIESLANADKVTIDGLVTDVNDRLKDIADALRSTLEDKPELHEHMVTNLRGETTEKTPPGMNFSEMKGNVKNMGTMPTTKEEDVLGDWHSWLAHNRADLDAHGVSPVDAKHRFAEEYTAVALKAYKGGFWRTLFGSLFSNNIEDIVQRRA